MTGTQIADNWRNYDPFLPMDVNLDGPGPVHAPQSFFTYDRFRANVLPLWGIDWNQIRAGNRARHVQPLQLLEEAARGRDQRRHGRGPAGQRRLAADVVPAGRRSTATTTSTPSTSPTPTSRRRSAAAPTRSGRSGPSARATSGGPASWRSTSTSSRRSPTPTSSRSGAGSKRTTRRSPPARPGEFGRHDRAAV